MLVEKSTLEKRFVAYWGNRAINVVSHSKKVCPDYIVKLTTHKKMLCRFRFDTEE